jgi:hypothetical protein
MPSAGMLAMEYMGWAVEAAGGGAMVVGAGAMIVGEIKRLRNDGKCLVGAVQENMFGLV